MTEKRFKHMKNRLGMQFIGFDDDYVLLGTFADVVGVKYIVDLLNQLNDENEKLEQDCSNLIDDNTEYVVEINQLHKENEQLKQKNKKLKYHLNKTEEELQEYKKFMNLEGFK